MSLNKLMLAAWLLVALVGCDDAVTARPDVSDGHTPTADTSDTPPSDTRDAGDGPDSSLRDAGDTKVDDADVLLGDAPTADALAPPDSRTSPRIFGFAISDAERARVTFASSEPITASNALGFFIEGKTITEVVINDGATSGHYFTVSDPFDYWDNHAIRYEGGSDIQDHDGNPVHPMTLSYIANGISIAEGTSAVFYVDGSVTSSGDGTTEAQAFKTLQEAVDAIPLGGGTKIWVKAGLYTEGAIDNTYPPGAVSAPNVIEGYKSVPGDITGMYYTYQPNTSLDPLDPSEMPLFDGGNRAGPTFLDLNDRSYVIVRNVQLTRYRRGIRALDIDGFEADNVLIKDIGATTANDGIGFAFQSSANASNNVRIRNSIVINATLDGILVYGQHPLIDGCAVYSNEAPAGAGDIDAPTDYYVALKGSNGIVRNTLVHKDTPNGWGHNGHGFSLKTKSDPVEHNLIVGCTAINIYGAFQARHTGCRHNVFKDSEAHADVPNRGASARDERSGGVQFFGGGSNNVFERLYVHDVDVAISWISSAEEDSELDIQQDSIIRNSVFANTAVMMRAYHRPGIAGTSAPSGNQILNCTFSNADEMWRFRDVEPFAFGAGNDFKNCIFDDIPVRDAELPYNGGWTYSYSNFNNTWEVEPGTSNVSQDPLFVDGSYELQSGSPLRGMGTDLSDVRYGKDGNERYPGSYDLGAYQLNE